MRSRLPNVLMEKMVEMRGSITGHLAVLKVQVKSWAQIKSFCPHHRAPIKYVGNTKWTAMNQESNALSNCKDRLNLMS